MEHRRWQMETNPGTRHPLLYGEYELTLDEKNRLLVPSEVRKSFVPERDGEGFFMVLGQNGRPWLYPVMYYSTLATSVPADIVPEEDLLSRDQFLFAMASKLEWDRQGRVLLPDKTLKMTGTTREVTLIGVRDHLELWNRTDWDQRRQELLARKAEVMLKARQAQ